jgi:ornithine cyclodeaminase/alanine dehydrogenase-like protein (mu-crystallin family)
MDIIFLSESDVKSLLTMNDAIDHLDELFKQEALGKVEHLPTAELHLPRGAFRIKTGGTYYMNSFGFKAYSGGGRRIVYLYDVREGLQAILDVIHLTQVRTGAASALATKYMARPEAETVGIIGSGKEARTQLEAVNCVRNLKHVKVYSRNPENREAFASEMSERIGVEVEPVASGEECVKNTDMVITITSASDPVLFGPWLEEGMHISGVGATGMYRRELDDEAIARCDSIVVEHLPVAMHECGELIHAANRGLIRWPLVRDIKDVVSGAFPSRTKPSDITLFDSIGIGAEDVAIADYVVRKAREKGIGTPLPMPGPELPQRAARE